MVKYTGKDGKDYILRFDMSAMEALGETFEGGYSEAITKLQGGDMSLVQQIFAVLANAGAEYMAEEAGQPMPEKITGEGLLSKHSSMGRVKAMMRAIEEAIKDGTRMQTKDEDDTEVRDGYLDEFREMERKEGKN